MNTITKGLAGITAICICLALAASPVYPQENIIRAKIGIMAQTGTKAWYAKSQERVAPGAKLRVYVHPEANAYVYVVHTDKKAVSLLVQKRVRAEMLVAPSEKGAYQIDGESTTELFTVVCSAGEVPELSSMQDKPVSYGEWASLEKTLIKRGKIELGQPMEKPIAIAGGVRGNLSDRSLQTYSARSLIVKKYEFSVKK
jgi:hypothetical protein